MGLGGERSNLGAGGQFWERAYAEIAQLHSLASEASHTCSKSLLKTISGVYDLYSRSFHIFSTLKTSTS